MSHKQPQSLIAPIATTSTWKWLVVPNSAPHLYVPAPSKAAAESIAAEIDAGTTPVTLFIHKAITPTIRAALTARGDI